MWFSFWRSRDRFSLDELRYLTEQLRKVQIVNEVNKDFVVEALRSIAEILTYGDQHDPAFFEFFMDEQIMGEFVRVLKVSRTVTVSVQLLQTLSIMIQNLRSEHAIYYIFSNKHLNYLITYTFDFQHEEILSYYISFLRAVSGKLNKNSISLLVKVDNFQDVLIDPITSLYLLCCVLRIVKIKDLANTTAAALFCPIEAVISSCQVKPDSDHGHESLTHGDKHQDNGFSEEEDGQYSSIAVSSEDIGTHICTGDTAKSKFNNLHLTSRETLLQYISEGDDVHALGSLFVMATLLQTKELEESMLDAFGILPQRKQHKKLLLQSLIGEASGEEQLFSPENGSMRDGTSSELDVYLRKLEEQFGLCCSLPGVGMNPRVHRNQVVDALVCLLCRENVSAETLWNGGWLLRQLLPYSEAEFNCQHHEMLKVSYEKRKSEILQEIKGIWPDLLITVLLDEWKKCKRVIEAPSLRKEPKFILLQLEKSSSDDNVVTESSFTAGERMCELVKVFVLLHHFQIFSLGRPLPEQPPTHPPSDTSETSHARTAGLDVSVPKPGTELKIVDAVPCRIAFERGKERHFYFLAFSSGVSGWIILSEESSLKPNYGIVRLTAPLGGCNPQIDEKHHRWLHLRIRPSTLPFLDPAKRGVYGKLKSKGLVDGRWTLAFRDEESCKSAYSMVMYQIDRQRNEVERRLKPLLELEVTREQSNITSDSSSSPSSWG
ncbi:PREDICTED: uncharacterized protein LOC104814647 isoform X5 [Tarenaya hassleriana]|uniref:uncharacterized protein LOC104814647 isoform X5 n=1 Tax=Tarenaya hassleriana TaxID=28532 RepID=UPI00053C32D6|nr:PREDICTED: uncharacterized protein LOC104814647 isoform X5 [Tarenaya hassleriana]